MKPRSIVLRSVAGLVLLASAGLAQTGPIPAISSIPSRNAFAPGNVVVNGTNLGLVFDVKVNGISLPIVRVTAARLVAGPLAPQAPGFAPVQLVHGRGTATGTLALTPTLTAGRRGLRVTSTLDLRAAGSYVLRLSYTPLTTPVVDPGIYYGRWLPLDATVLSAGVLPDATPLVQTSRIPVQVGLIGAPLGLQADCTIGAEQVRSYTNLAILLGFGAQQ